MSSYDTNLRRNDRQWRTRGLNPWFRRRSRSRSQASEIGLQKAMEGNAGMEVLESVTVTALDQLGNLYARPSERVLRKETDHVDAAGRAFITASPFLVLATKLIGLTGGRG
jgi:hypothetical protein